MSAEPEAKGFPAVPRFGTARIRTLSSPAAPEEPLSERGEKPVHFDWRKNVAAFVLTVVSVFSVGRMWTMQEGESGIELWLGAWKFAVPLLTILLCHEFGHYVAARMHRVPASLPYFLPLPILNPFGTLGAVIVMPNRIRSRRALLDIGAAGPLAGMVVAVPIMFYGLSLSTLGPVSTSSYVQEGQSLLYWAMKSLVFGWIPAGMDVQLHPTALAAWAGFLVTFLNLLPVGQLDGGHVAFALLGERQNKIARVMLYAPLALLVYNFFVYALPVLQVGFSRGFDTLGWDAAAPVISSLSSWTFALIMLALMKRYIGVEHPPVDDHQMEFGRKCVAVVTLVLFVLLFMPAPWVVF